LRIARFRWAVVLLLMLAACNAQKPYLRVGFAFATSGDNAVYGNSSKAGAQLAIDEINAKSEGPKITLFFEDTAVNPDQAVAAFRKFVDEDKVDAIIGPTLSNEAKSSDPLAQQAGVPVLAVSNTASGITEIGDYIFRDSISDAQIVPGTIKQAKAKLNLQKVSLLYGDDDAFGRSGADVFRGSSRRAASGS
jgi:branched-chain amino acid transport system substrate-binding protein